jgi:Flp pilus assembly pilin Flp
VPSFPILWLLTCSFKYEVPFVSPSLELREDKTEMKNCLERLWREEEGQDLVEYSLLLAFVALAATAGMNYLANAINITFSVAGTKLTSGT